MKPIDYRNENWDQVWSRATGDDLRALVYRAYQLHGACTTRQLARLMDKEKDLLLSVRPRVTELYDLGLVELARPEERGREGIYQAVPYAMAMARFERLKARAMSDQLSLGL